MHQRFDYKEINNGQILQNVTIVKIPGIKKSKCYRKRKNIKWDFASREQTLRTWGDWGGKPFVVKI